MYGRGPDLGHLLHRVRALTVCSHYEEEGPPLARGPGFGPGRYWFGT